MGSCRELGHREHCTCELSTVAGDIHVAEGFLNVLDRLDKLAEAGMELEYAFDEDWVVRVTQLSVSEGSWPAVVAELVIEVEDQQDIGPAKYIAIGGPNGEWLVEYHGRRAYFPGGTPKAYYLLMNSEPTDQMPAFGAYDIGRKVEKARWELGGSYSFELEDALQAWLRKESGSVKRLKELARKLGGGKK